MTNLIEYTSTDAAPSSPSRRAAPVALPFLLALGRGFTLAGWGAIILVSGIFGATVHWGLGRVLDFSLMALAGFLFVFLFVAITLSLPLSGLLPLVAGDPHRRTNSVSGS